MKRVFTLLFCIIMLAGCLCIPVSAESAASSVNLMCTVNSEGDCLVTMTVNLRLESNVEKIRARDEEFTRNMILKTCALKAKIVELDEKEAVFR